jgi:5-methylthioadenosine/S-adenosylhomocysteine deaminase
MPGFVDTHRHIWQTALRAICAEWSLKEYMRGIRFQRAKVKLVFVNT